MTRAISVNQTGRIRGPFSAFVHTSKIAGIWGFEIVRVPKKLSHHSWIALFQNTLSSAFVGSDPQLSPQRLLSSNNLALRSTGYVFLGEALELIAGKD